MYPIQNGDTTGLKCALGPTDVYKTWKTNPKNGQIPLLPICFSII